MHRATILLILSATAVPELFAQSNIGKPRSPAFKADSSLVLVPVTVIDRHGAVVDGLRPSNFNVFEDKERREISSFAEQDVPASIGVILDLSGSMKGVLNQAKSALRTFLDKANPGDEAYLYSVSTVPGKNSGFTDDTGKLLSGLVFADAHGSTALIDTIYCSLNEMRLAHRPRRALFIISDGMENHSRYSKTELMERAIESEIQIYAISIYDPPAYKKPIQLQEEHQGLLLLEELALRTGGLNLVVHNAEDLGSAAETISHAIRNEYTIGYVPQSANRDGKWHSIRVKLDLPELKAYARPGYYAY